MAIIVATLLCGMLQAQTRKVPAAKNKTGGPDGYTEQMAYEQAITTYIDSFFHKQHKQPDTLLIVRNNEMRIKSLPPVINGINIVFLPNKAAEQWKRNKTGQICLNVIGWPEPKEVSFIVISFIDWKPQHNCHMHFVLNNRYQLQCDSMHLEYPYKH